MIEVAKQRSPRNRKIWTLGRKDTHRRTDRQTTGRKTEGHKKHVTRTNHHQKQDVRKHGDNKVDSDSNESSDEDAEEDEPYFNARLECKGLLKPWSSEESIETALSLLSISTSMRSRPRSNNAPPLNKLSIKSAVFRSESRRSIAGLLRRENINGLSWEERHHIYNLGHKTNFQTDLLGRIEKCRSFTDVTKCVSEKVDIDRPRPNSAKSNPRIKTSSASPARTGSRQTYYHPGAVEPVHSITHEEYRKRQKANIIIGNISDMTGSGDHVGVYYPERVNGPLMSQRLRVTVDLGLVLKDDVKKTMGQTKYSALCIDSLRHLVRDYETKNERNLRIFNWLVDVRNS